MRPVGTVAAAATLLLLLAGCAQGGPMSTPSASGTRPPFQTTQPINTPSADPTTLSDERLQAIRADLAKRGVTAEPTVTSVDAVTWSDSSLGCPQPGMMYSQVITPGMKVVVQAGGKTFDYRFGRGDTPTLCQKK